MGIKVILYYLLTIGCVLVILIGCSDNSEPEDKSNSFGIYLPEDQSITWESLKSKNLDSIKLKEWITGDKIDFYDYSSHVIYLNVDYNSLLSVPHKDNTPFVVVANGKRCYYGKFSLPEDTTQPCVVFKPLESCNDLVMLEFNPPNRKDIRVNDEVVNALKEAGKFKPGLSSQLWDSPYVERAKDDTLVYFRLLLKNEEENNICIPSCIVYFIQANGKKYRSFAVFYNNNSRYIFEATDPNVKETIVRDLTLWYPNLLYDLRPHVNEYTSWYYRFPLKGLPDGNYNYYLQFYGMMGAPKNKRSDPNGRIWFGYLRTNTVNLNYDSKTDINILNLLVELP